MGFTKLDEGIVFSSVWSESLATRVVWVTMLAMCDSGGMVRCSRTGLIRAANVSTEDFEKAIIILESPDEDSRSPEYDGRRIEKCNGGWIVLNYKKYREYTYSSSPGATRQRKHRDKEKCDIPLRVTNWRDTSASASNSSSISSNIKDEEYIMGDVQKIIEYFNSVTGQRRRDDSGGLISGRLSEGRTFDDFKHVIDTKYARWRDDNKMAQFIRPSTLFRKGNFEDYLNEQKPLTEEEKAEKHKQELISYAEKHCKKTP